jgi:ubiquinol-cytochrome c reductase cytochrome b subunit
MSPSFEDRPAGRLRRIINWVEDRTGAETALKTFLYEDIPASSGWHQVFGSIALFAFMVQAFTGILLAFNYAPTPGDAYHSVRYIMTEVTAGSLIRGLHHWGASVMIIIVVLHMTQVFIWGAYKKPREATWIAGCFLLLLTLAFGLTGYLLPWDNRAYWGTVVTTQIVASAPGLGPYLTRLMGGSGGVGVVTFSRFYATHVLLLPPITMILVAIHLYLIRKHGVTPAPDDTRPHQKFFPAQVFKDTVAIFVVFTILFLMAVFVRIPLERVADPTDTAYIPRPEWYFLFLFQTLKFFEGPLEVVGAVILPNLAILALFLVPFLDRGRVVRVAKRTAAIGIVVFAGLGWAGLTAAAVATTPKNAETSATNELSQPATWQELSPEEVAAVGYFRAANCASCHQIGKQGSAPDLTKIQVRRPVDWMVTHFKEKLQASTPPVQLSDAQINSLATFFSKLNEKSSEALASAPQVAADGAIVYQKFQCAACHQVNGVGQRLGPPLNGVGTQRTRDWMIGHFNDPKKFSPGSIMPPYHFNEKDMNAITSYLLAIPK